MLFDFQGILPSWRGFNLAFETTIQKMVEGAVFGVRTFIEFIFPFCIILTKISISFVQMLPVVRGNLQRTIF